MLTQTAQPSAEAPNSDLPWLHRVARRLVLKSMQEITHGCLQIVESDTVMSFGDATTTPAQVRVFNSRFYLRLLLGGTVGAGEAYADGDWETPDLTGLVRLMVANRAALEGLDNALTRWLKQGFEKLEHWRNANTRDGSRRNIAAHYDLSNDFFRLWLDQRMMYSSAIFAQSDWDLDQASEYKLARLCELLQLQPGDHLLEIGTGWGGLAIYAAQHYDINVTTTTISREQFAEAEARVEAAGLQNRVELLLEDYRDLTGEYDKIVSIEMVEAVGDQFVDGYFNQVETLLRPGGRFVMQAITIDDQRYLDALNEVDFIKKHIFPGSFIPSVTRLVTAAARTPSMKLVSLDDIGLDYAQTLRCWSENFAAVDEQLAAFGFDTRFQRLWQFYFSYCEGGFLERTISDVHMVFCNQSEALADRSFAKPA